MKIKKYLCFVFLSLIGVIALSAKNNNTQDQMDHAFTISLCADGKTLVSGNGNDINVWNWREGKRLKNIKGHTDSVLSVSCSPDSKSLVSGSRDATTKLWNLKTGKLLRSWDTAPYLVTEVLFSPDGKMIVSAGCEEQDRCERSYIKFLNTSNNEVVRSLEIHSQSLDSLAISPDGKILASGGCDEQNGHHCEKGSITFWEVNSGKFLRTFESCPGYLDSLSFSPDGKLIASGSEWEISSTGGGHNIKIWDIQTGKLLRTIKGHAEPVLSVAFSPDGKMLASGSQDQTIKFWDPDSGSLLLGINVGYWVSSIAFSPDGKSLALGSCHSKEGEYSWNNCDTTIDIWDVKTGKLIRSF